MSEIEAATRADSRDSIAAKAATAAAGPSRMLSVSTPKTGNTGAGSLLGNAPITLTGRLKTNTGMLTTTMAMIDPGTLRWIRGASTMIAATTTPIASDQRAATGSKCANDWIAATRALLLDPALDPIAAGTCCRKMITAIPSVNPSITGHGM